MKPIGTALLDELLARAATVPRRRSHHNLHATATDPIQRLLVAAKRDSYFRPHRHPGKWELALVLRGRLEVVCFADDGRVTLRVAVGAGAPAVGGEVPADTWHAWVPLTDDATFFEVKAGPYDPRTAAEFPAWAPAEDSPAAAGFAAWLRAAAVGAAAPGG